MNLNRKFNVLNNYFLCFFVAFIFFNKAIASIQSMPIITVGDIEGISEHWNNLERNGIIEIENDKVKVSPNQKVNLAFMGDLARRGPFGIESTRRVLNILSTNPGSFGIIGNHDANPLSFLQIKPSLELGDVEVFNDWLDKNNKQNNIFNQLEWWADKYGLQDKINNYWLELVLEKEKNSTHKNFLTEGKIDHSKLSAIITSSEMAKSFLLYISPEGLNFKYLEKADLVRVVDTSENKRLLFMHSGQPTQSNLGVIPEVSEKYYDRYEGKDWLKYWSTDLNQWKNSQLELLKQYYTQYLKASSNGDTNNARIFSKKLISLKLPSYADAGWDQRSKSFVFSAESVVYPDPNKSGKNILPKTPGSEVLNRLAGASVNFVIGGHYPVGDSSIVRSAFASNHNKHIDFITVDTSYSPREGKSLFKIHPNGTYRGEATLRDGKHLVSVNFSENKKLSLIGKYYNKSLIIGYEANISSQTGELKPNFDRIITAKQNLDFSFDYSTVESKDVVSSKLSYFSIDSNSYEDNKIQQKISQMNSYNKTVVSSSELKKILSGSHVIVNFGPNQATFNEILSGSEHAKNMIQSYLESWRNELIKIDTNQKTVIITDGENGLGSEKTKIALEVNKNRIAQGGKPFIILGNVNATSDITNLDSSVKKMTLSGLSAETSIAHLSKTIKDLHLRSKPNFEFRFAGGGNSTRELILNARLFKKTGNNVIVKIILESGFSLKNNLSATDLEIKKGNVNSNYEIKKVSDYNVKLKKKGRLRRSLKTFNNLIKLVNPSVKRAIERAGKK